MSNVRYLGMLIAIGGLLMFLMNYGTREMRYIVFILGVLMYAGIGYLEQYRHQEISLT